MFYPFQRIRLAECMQQGGISATHFNFYNMVINWKGNTKPSVHPHVDNVCLRKVFLFQTILLLIVSSFNYYGLLGIFVRSVNYTAE
jgi:hypothetical protein